jgi:hypothetical protein
LGPESDNAKCGTEKEDWGDEEIGRSGNREKMRRSGVKVFEFSPQFPTSPNPHFLNSRIDNA